MSLYSNLATTALAQINDKGRTVLLRPQSGGVYDPANDTFTPDAAADISVKALVTDVEDSEINGTTIQAGDKRVTIAASALVAEPEMNDMIIDGSDQLRVVAVNTLKPGDTALLYKLTVRR